MPLDVVSIHPHRVRQAATAAFSSQDLEVGCWMCSAASATLQVIRARAPTVVTTSEARLLRTGLDR